MDSYAEENNQQLRELAADLDMILPSSGYVDPTNERPASETPLDTIEEQRLGLVEPPKPAPRERISVPARPGLRREGSVPAPSQPPPAPPPTVDPPPQPTDSLSLMQLRSLVKELPRVEPTPYAFVYKDAATLPEEIEEWFAYTTPERANILRAQSCFATEWGMFNDWAFTGDESSFDWNKASESKRLDFMKRLLQSIRHDDIEKRLEHLEALVYCVLGCWDETAGLEAGSLTLAEASTLLSRGDGQKLSDASDPQDAEQEKSEAEIQRDKAVAEQYSKSGFQIQWLKNNTKMLLSLEDSLQTIFDVMRTACERECTPDSGKVENNATKVELEKRETWCALTIFYVCLEVARTTEHDVERLEFRSQLLSLDPNLLVFLGNVINKIRWDPGINGELQQSPEKGPSPKLLLLTWKALLVCFGGLDEVEIIRNSFKEKDLRAHLHGNGPLITASPLDYHTFRQEISSKYPAYSPPPSYFPLEPEQRSMLPPLRVNPSKPQASSMPVEPAQHGTSILHQPVHIATPAPSPPPSPALGKGGKKQNYQTPHLLPFNYPPLDTSSNEIGGKGSTQLQDALVGRKWQGSDIPTSILEAAELFAKRMRATRALKQLWEERVEFMKYERGWTGADEDEDLRPLDEITTKMSKSTIDHRKRFDGSIEERLETVDSFYREGLPNLQSIVMVMMKTILGNVTSLITQVAGQASVQSGFQFQDNGNGTTENRPNPAFNDPQADIAKLGQDELDRMRGEEIAAKAVTGLLLLLLKWFKISHVLKFEYLTQLLVDANYIPMVLKLLQTQEIERVVNYRCESEDWNFFRYCRAHSRIGLVEEPVLSPEQPEEPSDDEAAPPPIKRHRSPPPPVSTTSPPLHQEPLQQQQQLPATFPPEVDELGIPTTQLPATPITTFSWRNFYTNINYLRILQKICKNKAHRNLMLITYKSANHLKKSLKVPQRELRLYTLKLFKNQVPYCGRKWRQGNMRVITAVYLHVRPDLRDDWLSGSDVDGDVEQSVPMEQSLRALTHWFNLRRWPEVVGSKKGVLKEEQDFFARELEKMGYGINVIGSVGDEWDDAAVIEGGVEWGVGQLEGW